MSQRTNCPQCGELLVHPRGGNAYCEECGFPDENRGNPAGVFPFGVRQRRTKGWRMPPSTVSVARSSKWGNPYPVGRLVCHDEDKEPERIKTPERSIELYQIWLLRQICWGQLDITELTGKNLACFCPLDQPCHRNVLLRLANPKVKLTGNAWYKVVRNNENTAQRFTVK